MKRLRFTVAKNAVANIIRGGASAVVALVLPHFLTRDLTITEYSAWVLILQIAAWANYLDFGLQTAVARHVAQAMERRDSELRDRVISTAFFLLLAAAGIALFVASAVIWQMPSLFHRAPHLLIDELRWGVLVLSASAASLLPLSTFTGILVGIHRNEFPALAIGGTRLLGGLGILCVVHFTHSLVWLALCLGAFNLLGGILQYGFALRLLPGMQIRLRLVTKAVTFELAHYCAGLTVFSFGMLLVSGLDLTVVGYFAFGATGYYAVSSTIIGFLTGLSGSVYSALLAPMAVLHERGEYSRIRDLILSTTRFGSYGSLVTVIAIILFGRPLITSWVGPLYASRALPILEILLWAQAIRLTASTYSVALVATAQQNYGIAAALTEGITNLLASIVCARLWGPIGVAWGTLIGAVSGVLCVLFWVMGRAKEVQIVRSDFTLEAILRPVFCFLPLLLYSAVHDRLNPSPAFLICAVVMNLLLLLGAGRIPRISRAGRSASIS